MAVHQIDDNLAKPRRRTGPNSPEGKAISSRNALKHGLLAQDAVLPDEDKEAFRDLYGSLAAEHQPATQTEEALVLDMAEALWRMRRLRRVETGVFRSEERRVGKECRL